MHKEHRNGIKMKNLGAKNSKVFELSLCMIPG